MPPPSRLRRLAPLLVAFAVLAVALVALVAVRTPAGAEATGLAVPPTPVPPAFPPTHPDEPVPASPSPVAPVCSPLGLSVTAGEVDAGLGHRAVVLTVTNCGSGPRVVTGYPDVAVLDATGAPMPFTVAHDSSYMVRDPGPAPLVLQPGQTAVTGVSWSATVTAGGLTEGQALRVVPVPGDVAQVLPVWVDAGTTGEIAVAAWATELAQ
ncbi:Protein of unknown function [Geodermatophilus dictyosporus]|uniref:DUF4232 domain-containing protein n=1 Tax=Geodermatophilus dictyosporus TaxID=1523247 RepID=A0A1I5TN16_9ACTN|nr:DUF4232 domain-containing protein [Geodermatophilus dictyosporus]SFP84484.1 Protein of unknown function [Geodermatophilus dictyosporus]